jgi:hypothetical protein
MMSCLVYIYRHSPDENLGFPSMNHEYLQTHTHTIYTVHTIESSQQENEHLCSHQQWRWVEVYKNTTWSPYFLFQQSMDWFSREILQETLVFTMKIIGFSCYFFPIQFYVWYDFRMIFPYDKQLPLKQLPESLRQQKVTFWQPPWSFSARPWFWTSPELGKLPLFNSPSRDDPMAKSLGNDDIYIYWLVVQ